MGTIQTLINIIIFAINCCALAFLCFIVSRWIGRAEQNIDLLNKSVDTQLKRLDAVYMNSLLLLQQMYATTEQYERAAQLQKVIELEVKLQKERNEKNIQN